MRYRLEASFVYHETEADDPDLNTFLDRVDEHLVDQLGAQEVFIASEGASNTFTVALSEPSAEDEDVSDAFARAMGTLRAAFHAEGCSTPNWPGNSELVSAGMVKQTKDRALQPA